MKLKNYPKLECDSNNNNNWWWWPFWISIPNTNKKRKGRRRDWDLVIKKRTLAVKGCQWDGNDRETERQLFCNEALFGKDVDISESTSRDSRKLCFPVFCLNICIYTAYQSLNAFFFSEYTSPNACIFESKSQLVKI